VEERASETARLLSDGLVACERWGFGSICCLCSHVISIAATCFFQVHNDNRYLAGANCAGSRLLRSALAALPVVFRLGTAVALLCNLWADAVISVLQCSYFYELRLGESAAVLFRINTLLYLPFAILAMLECFAHRSRVRPLSPNERIENGIAIPE